MPGRGMVLEARYPRPLPEKVGVGLKSIYIIIRSLTRTAAGNCWALRGYAAVTGRCGTELPGGVPEKEGAGLNMNGA